MALTASFALLPRLLRRMVACGQLMSLCSVVGAGTVGATTTAVTGVAAGATAGGTTIAAGAERGV